MSIYFDFLDKNEDYIKLKKDIECNVTPILTAGVIDTQKSHIIAAIAQSLDRSSLIITNSELRAKEIYNDLKFFLKDKVQLYPSKDVIFYWADVKSLDIIKERFEIISRLVTGEKTAVVLSVEALFDRLVPRNVFESFIINIKVGDKLDIQELCRQLVFMGYERCDMVEGQGQFALRGGIFDIYSSVSSNAVRIELWDDEVDSVRILDTVSQRSVENARELTIYPMRELVYKEEDIEKAVENMESELKSYKNVPDKIKLTINEITERLREEKSFSGIEKYINYFYDNTVTLMDYFDDDAIVYLDEPSRVADHSKFILNEFTESIEGRIEKGHMLPSQMNMIYSYEDIVSALNGRQTILMCAFLHTIKEYDPKSIISFSVKSIAIVKNDLNLMTEDISYMCKKGNKVIFLAGGHTKCMRMLNELTERNIKAVYAENTDDASLKEGVVCITRGYLSHGFEYTSDKLAVITENDVLVEEKKRRRTRRKSKDGTPIQNISDLKVGDYVVHENHGVGIYRGIEQILTDGVSKDYMKIGYAKEDVLYVAINQMDMVQKYIGGETAKPKLNRLGGTSWERAKSKARQAAHIAAKDLVELYALRQEAKGYMYSPDTLWQREFEEDFEYEETEDQLAAIEDVKSDMEAGKVMDRLICGDVGYGKTEIAIRAAFKTVQDGKQVAYLVPTTILAKQHYVNFKARMEPYPVVVKMLSRFVNTGEQKKIVSELKSGKTDIVIGTHRILSKDISFKDLGLVIIDEEQRFGVAHKEKLKELRKNVNVLTLTATPIPRTLHMSMTGIRDMSILEEPPHDRLPVQTYVMEYEQESVRDAIHRELARNGQVYFLYNRVNNISNITRELQALVPEARFAFAHGKMGKKELEDIMMEFTEGNIDVLVCTTIIETGLDIPNVNTIIISNADKMGLSQLYQLRGRVGRSYRTSYAYLMYARDKVLQQDAEKRLQTIKEFTEFGSGFRVAMRDLEIRGAGNLLGAEQHGHMDSVGYELYCKLLNEAVMELKGIDINEEFETAIDIKLNAFIPNSYISNEEQKLEMYKKISLISGLDDYYDVQEEMEDRFGTMPRSVANLLDVALTKAMGHSIGTTNIAQKGNKILIYFKSDASVNTASLMKTVSESKGRILFTANGGEPYITYGIMDEKNVLSELRNLITAIS